MGDPTERELAMNNAFTDWFKYTFLHLPMLASEHGERVDNC
jgi:hypothetical protein